MTMSEAVPAYLRWLESEAAWLVDRFVCPAGQLGELAQELAKAGYESEDDRGIDVTVIASPIANASKAAQIIAADLEQMKGYGVLMPSAYEVRVPLGDELKGVLNGLKKMESFGVDLYLEFGWQGDWVQAMHDAAATLEDAGFKARTGGVTADAFPSSELLAEFLATSLALDAPFKFTAGMHEPLRYFDPLDGAYHHGFINAMVASAVALMEDLSQAEIVEILNFENASAFEFTEEGVSVRNWKLDHDDLDDFWNFFGGFGSCSVQEPLDGLRRHGWLR